MLSCGTSYTVDLGMLTSRARLIGSISSAFWRKESFRGRLSLPGSPGRWVAPSQLVCLLLAAICFLCALYDLALFDHEILEMEAFFFLLSVTYASGSTYGNFPLCAYVLIGGKFCHLHAASQCKL